jgi:dihydroxy-acid dehydratase
MKSDKLKKQIETLPHRALLLCTGLKKEDFSKPFIGVANSFNDLIPGHVHLRELAKEVKRGIRDAGGVPFEWGVPGVCDGIAMYVEMRLSLASREHIADNIEIMMLSHSLDGWVGITNCDKITPGMLMAAGRLDLPSIILTGGPMKANIIDNIRYDPIRNFGMVGEVKGGRMSAEEAEKFMYEKTVCGPGSCCGLYTANTMACLTETLGMSLTGCATTLAVDPKKMEQAYQTGRRAVELVLGDIRPSSIMTPNAFDNAIMVDMAIGGSTNTALHIPAIARELKIDLSLDLFDSISRDTPNICQILPAGPWAMEDLDRAGGIPAVLNCLKDRLKNSSTVNGEDIRSIAAKAEVKDNEVIRPVGNPYKEEGGIAVLKGNLAEYSVIKQTAVSADMLTHTGPAKVFTDEHSLMAAIKEGKIEEGDVVVLSFLGPAGAPGMPEMLSPTDAIKGAGFKKVALITDGRFSGGTSGPCIGHIEPEAYLGGAIGAIRDGDIIEIDIPNRSLQLRLTDEEIKARKENLSPPERKASPFLVAYRSKFI